MSRESIRESFTPITLRSNGIENLIPEDLSLEPWISSKKNYHLFHFLLFHYIPYKEYSHHINGLREANWLKEFFDSRFQFLVVKKKGLHFIRIIVIEIYHNTGAVGIRGDFMANKVINTVTNISWKLKQNYAKRKCWFSIEYK